MRTRHAVGVVLASGAVALSPGSLAHADMGYDRVLADLAAAGFTSSQPNGLLNNVVTACTGLQTFSVSYMTSSLMQGTGMSQSSAAEFLDIVMTDVCPLQTSMPQTAPQQGSPPAQAPPPKLDPSELIPKWIGVPSTTPAPDVNL